MCFGVGLVCGFYDGFFGPGAGTLMIMLFTWVAGMDMVTASGTAKPVNLASNLASLTSFLLSGDVLFPPCRAGHRLLHRRRLGGVEAGHARGRAAHSLRDAGRAGSSGGQARV